MKSGDSEAGVYIWQHPSWPRLRYDLSRLAGLLAAVHGAQGHLLGRMTAMGMPQRDAATLRVLTDDVLKTSEIEGEQLNPETVRSSIARRRAWTSARWRRPTGTSTAWWRWCSTPPAPLDNP